MDLHANDLTPAELDKIRQLRAKFALAGQDMVSYLEGLLHARYLTYWDYLQLDTLLSLQIPRTDFPDEHIFIGYHQITELYFQLIQRELNQLVAAAADPDNWHLRLRRVVAYFRQLTASFDTMVEGMQPAQFLQFRMALLPASGFQSVQYREIEIKLTTLSCLVAAAQRPAVAAMPPAEAYEHIYWKLGNRNAATGEKTLTLQMFEQRYDTHLRDLASRHAHTNLRAMWLAGSALQADGTIRQLLRQIDLYANVFWRLAHFKSAARYLQRDPEDIKATGGTNWQKYLPPRFQQVVFYPELWSANELANWGRDWVVALFKQQVEDRWTV